MVQGQFFKAGVVWSQVPFLLYPERQHSQLRESCTVRQETRNCSPLCGLTTKNQTQSLSLSMGTMDTISLDKSLAIPPLKSLET